MLCCCANSLAKALSALGPVGPNANLAGSLAAGLNANAGLVAAANAVLAANAGVAADANLAAGASLAAGTNLNAMASLNALASFCADMKRGFGIDMGGTAAPGELSDLFQSLLNNAWNKALAKLPLNATPSLQGLGDIASAIPVALDMNVNILGPNAEAKLNAAAKASANANASLGLSTAAAATMSAQLSAAASANANLKAAFGAGLGYGINAGGLGESLKNVTANMAALPNFGEAITKEVIEKLLKLLKALDALKRGLGVDLTVPGAAKNLDKAISETRDKSAEKLAAKSKSKSASKDQSRSNSKQQDLSEALDFSKSQDFNRIFGKGVPGVPNLAGLLATLANRLMSETGVSMTERSPCGPQCLLMPMVPSQCLCPKVKMELPKLPALTFKPQVSAGVTSSMSAAASPSLESKAKKSGSADGSTESNSSSSSRTNRST